MSGIGGHVRRNAHGMGAPGLASPVEPGSALDDGPAPDVDFEAGGMFEGVGGGGQGNGEYAGAYASPRGSVETGKGFSLLARRAGVSRVAMMGP